MFSVKSVPDKTKVSKKEWVSYITNLSNYKPSKKQKELSKLFNKKY